MNQHIPNMSAAALSVVETETAEGLAAINNPACAAAIWRRKPERGFQAWLDGLAPEALPSARLILRPDEVRAAISAVFDDCQTPEGPERSHLIDDIVRLADIFVGVIAAPYLRLRLSPVDTNACRRFHIDAVTARLICTYRGAGTQYGISTDGAEPRRVFTVPTGSSIVLRGTKWPERPASGLLHRSPPIEGSGETRLLFVIDPIFDLEDAA